MTSPLIHHVPNWHVASMITRPTDSDWWLWWNSDCGMQLWPVVWCRRIITWLPLKVPTLTLNLDNWEASSTSFFRCWLLIAPHHFHYFSPPLSILLMLRQKVPQQQTSVLSVDFWPSWSSAARERRDVTVLSPRACLLVSNSRWSKATTTVACNYSDCCIGRWKVWLSSKCWFGFHFFPIHCNWFMFF